MRLESPPRIRRQEVPPVMRGRFGYRNAEPCHEQDIGVHFAGSHDGLLQPLAPCGEYHVSMLRLNRQWLCELRRERVHKQSHLNEALHLLHSLELAIETRPEETISRIERRMLSFLQQEIETLQSDLAAVISLV